MGVCFQRRDLNDAAAPAWLHRDKQSRFVFLAAARTRLIKDDASVDDQEIMEGEVFIFSKRENDDGKTWRDIRKLVNNRTRPGLIQTMERKDMTMAKAWKYYGDTCRSFLREHSLFVCRFCICRDGITTIQQVDDLSPLELRNKLFIPMDTDGDLEDLDVVIRQIFYFLRDCCHAHQHHSRYHDTMTIAWRVMAGSHKSDENASGRWLLHTGRQLYRTILELRRSASPTSFCQARGILEYVVALDRIIEKRHVQHSSPSKSSLGYEYDRTRLSLSIKETELGYEKSRRNNLVAVFCAIFLPLAGLSFAAAAFISEPDILVDPLITSISYYCASHFGVVLWGCLSVSLVSCYYVQSVDFINSQVLRVWSLWIIRYLQSLPRWAFVSLAVIIAAISFVCAFKIVGLLY